MRSYIFLISFFLLTLQLKSQSTINLCKGDIHNFSVPFTNGSVYNWQIQNPLIANISSGNGTEHITLDLNNSGVVQLLVEEIDLNGCVGYDSILIHIHDLPEANISVLGSSSFCEGDSVQIKLENDFTYNIWNNGLSTPFIYADTSGFFFTTVIDSNGCSNTSNSIYINVEPKPLADYFIVGDYCVNTPIQFINASTVNSGANSTLIWYFDNKIRSGDTVIQFYNTAGNYSTELLIISDLGCSDTVNKTFTIFNNPAASFIFHPTEISILNPNVNFINTSVDLISSFWDFGDSTISLLDNPTHEFDNPGAYDVLLTVSDINQCVDSVVHKVMVYYDYILYIPNTFTPNNDGENDLFGPKGLRMNKYMNYQFIIYNRWGEEVFFTEDVSDKWSGEGSQDGVYNWVVIITDELGRVRKEVGEIMLIR